MDAQVETLGTCKRKIAVQVPVEEVKKKFEENYENLRKNLELPGFRRGRVPRRLIEKRFGDDVAKDVRQALVEQSYEEAVKKNELRVVGQPDFGEEQPPIKADQPFSYTAMVEVRPTFELPDYSKISLKKPSVEPADEELNNRIDFYRHRMATVENVETGAEKTDYVIGEIDVRAGEQSILKREKVTFQIERNVIEGIKVDNLAEQCVGLKAGDVKTLEVTLPDTFHIEEQRGKPATLVVTAKDVKREILPEANDAWAKEMGFDSLDEFRQEIKKQITRTKESEAREHLRMQIRDALAELVPMELPENITKRVSEDNTKRNRLLLQYHGLTEREIEEKMKEQVQESEVTAQKNLKLYFIFDEIATKETIFVTEDELHARADQMAANYGVEPERLWERMDKEGQLDDLRKEMVDEKIVDFLITKARVEQEPPAAPAAPAAHEEGKLAE